MVSKFMQSCQIGSPAPMTGATFAQANVRAFAHSFKFSGRASRSEYWWATLGLVVVTGAAEFYARRQQKAAIAHAGKHYPEPEIDQAGKPLPGELKRTWRESRALDKAHPVVSRKVSDTLMFASAVPALSLSVRRLHDTGRSGHWMWINLLPLAGNLVSVVQSSQKPNPRGARFD